MFEKIKFQYKESKFTNYWNISNPSGTKPVFFIKFMSNSKFKIHNIRVFMFISIMVWVLEYALRQYWIISEDIEIYGIGPEQIVLVGYSEQK